MGRGAGSNGGGRGRSGGRGTGGGASGGGSGLSLKQQAEFARAVRRDALPSSLSDKQLARAFVVRTHGHGGTFRQVLGGHMTYNGPKHMAAQGGIVREAVRRGLVDSHDQGGPSGRVGFRLSDKGQRVLGVTFKTLRRAR